MYMNSQFFLMLKRQQNHLFVTLFMQYHLKLNVAYIITSIYMFCFAFVDKSILKSIDTGLTMHGDFR